MSNSTEKIKLLQNLKKLKGIQLYGLIGSIHNCKCAKDYNKRLTKPNESGMS
jgi:hypothetical protein